MNLSAICAVEEKDKCVIATGTENGDIYVYILTSDNDSVSILY